VVDGAARRLVALDLVARRTWGATRMAATAFALPAGRTADRDPDRMDEPAPWVPGRFEDRTVPVQRSSGGRILHTPFLSAADGFSARTQSKRDARRWFDGRRGGAGTMRAMNESDARTVLFVRAFEAEPQAGWSDADAAWAGHEAARTLGERAAPDVLIAERARLAFARMVERRPALRGLHAASGWPAWANAALPLLAFAAGLATDAIGSSGRINLLAPPLFGLLLWNLAVYAVLAFGGLRASLRSSRAQRAHPLRDALGRALHSAARRLGQRAEFAAPAAARFTADWLAAGGRLNAARVGALLHAGAALFAAGLLASLYLRGIAFEYRAGWDSTFLSAEAVRRVLATALWPALALSGASLPDAQQLAALRFSAGPGENAARWIHLYALTAALVVLLPRGLLAAWAAWRARRLAAHIELPLHEAYFQRLLRAQRGAPIVVQVLPCNYRLPADRASGLAAALERELGAPIDLRLAPAVPLGAEDDPAHWPPVVAGALPVALFALTATPEQESHGAFLRRLAARQAPGTTPLLLIDESGFRERFGNTDGARRLEQRRDSWRRWLREQGVMQPPLFADLARSGATAGDATRPAAVLR
jgi:hypothetical protein